MSRHSNSAGEQRRRVLAWLLGAPLTTLEARAKLDVMHPAARVLELRRVGYYIETLKAKEATPCGRLHCVARYVLTPSGDGHTLPLPFPMGLAPGGRASA